MNGRDTLVMSLAEIEAALAAQEDRDTLVDVVEAADGDGTD